MAIQILDGVTFAGGVTISGTEGPVLISKAFFYNKRLTSTEVLQNYNSTKGEFGL